MAEGAGLLNRYTGNCIVGSNPISSANYFVYPTENKEFSVGYFIMEYKMGYKLGRYLMT